ncbi:site-specific integrase [Aliiroseovarius crassostreae]|uniref:tyrosine-type recombinase/integrase n=1 Tax=Aliiroseovarius crassostreae TaxID=154981 RepID=UPI00223B6531|nr:site-specific integrase [Aliiroseovarius crassostreae]
MRDALKPIWKAKHATAKKAFNRTRIIFKSARLMGYDCDPFTVEAAKEMLGAVHYEPEHMAALPWQEVPALYAELAQREHAVSALALRWSILTVVRAMAVRGARHDEIDGDVWTVPADRIKGARGKVKDFRVPLSSEAMLIAEKAAQFPGPMLFPGRNAGTVSDVAMNKMLRSIRPGVTVHGLRTTFRTWVQETDSCSYEVSETILGHTIGSAVERAYARSDLLDRRRVAMEAWARYVTGAEANVIPISAAGQN